MRELLVAISISIMFAACLDYILRNESKKATLEERVAILETKMYYLERK